MSEGAVLDLAAGVILINMLSDEERQELIELKPITIIAVPNEWEEDECERQ